MTVTDTWAATAETNLAATWDLLENIRILTTYRPSSFEQRDEAGKEAELTAAFGTDPWGDAA